MVYRLYEISIACVSGLKFLSVTACDLSAAYADVREAYGQDVDIVGARLV